MSETKLTMGRISYGNANLYVCGLDLNCPLCGTLVRSGENHTCSRPEPIAKPKRTKRK